MNKDICKTKLITSSAKYLLLCY